ncbi:hypothetical protein SISSUDRAFT_209673 [Sistotremastrum suecicum HHB10207 ss-3]|nr:hypothetical protein SISSUDRAFT_209673 [Sistotremastrum suecicum HHB10207 ss-3]
MCLLSALHMNCMKKLSPTSDIHETSTEDMNLFYGRTKKALTEKVQFEQYDEGDAMASLHVVSSFLFTGGRGPWPFFLTIAMNWVEAKLRDPRYTHLEDILYRASESESFIIRTTMWFDVWASITQIRQPRFLNVYRQLFGNPRSYVVEADQGMNSPDILGGPSYLSMVPIVGCTNESFRAMAEIANLASWKETENEQSRLSIPTLVQRGLQIEEMYLPRLRPTVQEPTNEMEFRRKVVSDVFRASARVYLHTVLSKGYPSCPEIEDGVAETIECLKLVPPQEGMTTRAVVRSVVFSICICGCLTDRPDQQQFLLQRLESLGEEANVFGNCAEVKKLMQKVWAMREERKGMALCWKEIMQEGGSDILLLV